MNPIDSLKPEQVFGYTRQSVSRKSDGRSKSISDQRSENQDTARFQLGVDIPDSNMLDEDKNHGGDEFPTNSGMDAMVNGEACRRVLGIIVDKIRSGECKALVVWSTCRLWRRVSLCEFLVDLIAKNSVILVDRNGILDCHTPDGRNRLFAAATSSQHLREMAQVNSPRGVRRTRERRLAVVGCDTCGLRNLGNGRVKIVPDEVELVKRIFREFVSGIPRTQIAKRLMAEGIQIAPDVQHKRSIKRTELTKSIIHVKTITTILTNPRYIGKYPHEGRLWECDELLIDGQTIIDPALFNEAQELLNATRRTSNSAKAEHYLAGLFRCAYCGQYLSCSPQKQKDGSVKKFWQNKKSDTQSWCSHNLPTITEIAMSTYTETVLMPLLHSQAVALIHTRDADSVANQIAILEWQIQSAETDFDDRVGEIFGNRRDGDGSRAMKVLEDKHNAKIAEMQKALAQLRMQLERESNSVEFAAGALSSWQKLNQDQKRIAIHKILRWVALIASDDFLSRPERRAKKRDRSRDAGAPSPGKIVFCSAFRTLHTAVLTRERPADATTHHRRLVLIPAPPSECVGTVADMPDGGAGFASGLRRSYDCRGYRYKPEDVLPGFGQTNDPPVIDLADE